MVQGSPLQNLEVVMDVTDKPAAAGGPVKAATPNKADGAADGNNTNNTDNNGTDNNGTDSNWGVLELSDPPRVNEAAAKEIRQAILNEPKKIPLITHPALPQKKQKGWERLQYSDGFTTVVIEVLIDEPNEVPAGTDIKNLQRQQLECRLYRGLQKNHELAASWYSQTATVREGYLAKKINDIASGLTDKSKEQLKTGTPDASAVAVGQPVADAHDKEVARKIATHEGKMAAVADEQKKNDDWQARYLDSQKQNSALQQELASVRQDLARLMGQQADPAGRRGQPR